jgi:hypothetical protein
MYSFVSLGKWNLRRRLKRLLTYWFWNFWCATCSSARTLKVVWSEIWRFHIHVQKLLTVDIKCLPYFNFPPCRCEQTWIPLHKDMLSLKLVHFKKNSKHETFTECTWCPARRLTNLGRTRGSFLNFMFRWTRNCTW